MSQNTIIYDGIDTKGDDSIEIYALDMSAGTFVTVEKTQTNSTKTVEIITAQTDGENDILSTLNDNSENKIIAGAITLEQDTIRRRRTKSSQPSRTLIQDTHVIREVIPLKTSTSSVKDGDGNTYETIIIGNQEWIAKNLKTTKYNDGSAIPLVTDNGVWSELSGPAYCWYHNNQVAYGDTYGALYNWYAVNTGKLCPVGWRVPNQEDWQAFIDYLGGYGAGLKIKQVGTSHWRSPNSGATNETGYTALPGSSRWNTGNFDAIGNYAGWWTSTQYDGAKAWYRQVGYNSAGVSQGFLDKKYGYSVRCVRNVN